MTKKEIVIAKYIAFNGKEFDDCNECLAYEKTIECDGVFYIENTINEFSTSITGYFGTFDDAVTALENCSDWFKPSGTGTIWFEPFGLKQKRIKVLEKK